MWVQKMLFHRCGSQKFGSKIMWVQKIVGPKQIGSQQNLGQNKCGSQKFGLKNGGSKNLGQQI